MNVIIVLYLQIIYYNYIQNAYLSNNSVAVEITIYIYSLTVMWFESLLCKMDINAGI